MIFKMKKIFKFSQVWFQKQIKVSLVGLLCYFSDNYISEKGKVLIWFLLNFKIKLIWIRSLNTDLILINLIIKCRET